MNFALDGIRVIDVSQVAAVPMTARFLADFGADVIHIEHPEIGDSARTVQARGSRANTIPSDINYIWENLNRNKRSVAINLSQQGGREILYKLAENADVFLTNMRPYELERFKLQYDTLSQLNSKLIYGSLYVLGKKGTERDMPGYDHTAYWARTGFPHRFGEPGKIFPGYIGAFGDHVAALGLAYGVMTALYWRERTGRGQEVDTSLFQIGVYNLGWDLAGALVTERDMQQLGRAEQPPLTNIYQTKDKRWLRIAGIRTDRNWSRFCQIMEREDLEHDPRFEAPEARRDNEAALFSILDGVFRTKTLEEWKIRFSGSGLSWSPVQTYPEVIADPQARANDFFVAIDHPKYGRMKVIANPINLSQTPATIRIPAPELGQHTEEVLLEHGYTWEDMVQFKNQGVII